ncbi:hypothetical protein DCC26_01775 [Auritidibacter sp. NML120779]|nr:hypothetical protein DCC26_01775 [Auritidibacter sp. NML120779]
MTPAHRESEVVDTRTCVTVDDGAVVQVEGSGLVATTFDHFDYRPGERLGDNDVIGESHIKREIKQVIGRADSRVRARRCAIEPSRDSIEGKCAQSPPSGRASVALW